MRQRTPSLPPGQPNPALVRKLFYVQQGCLALVTIVAIVVFAAWLSPAVAFYLPAIATQMSIPIALAALLCTFSLVLSEPGSHLALPRLSRAIAMLAGILAFAVLLENTFHLFPALDTLLDSERAGPNNRELALQPPAAFALLAIVMILVNGSSALTRRIADVAVSLLCLLTLILVSENLFGALGLFGLLPVDLISPLVLFCISLLTMVVALRQAEHGMFSIFLGCGIGSRIARGFAPALLVLPFLSEVVRTHLELRKMVAPQYGNATFTSIIAAISILLLLFLVWRINTMEQEIHDLTLRDDLTGLYNMRGFYLLAEQTLRLAQRAQLPFSVIFIDLDGLKQINDQMGHNTGSAYLAETGELVATTFREGDVKGRFGGDEFVIAGQFSVVGIEIATQRLLNAAAERNVSTPRKFPLSLSIGHVTADYYSQETLKDLVTQADQAMYKEKRRKKLQRA
jgi:diguanylate cyclase (GGDEF)-like protein